MKIRRLTAALTALIMCASQNCFTASAAVDETNMIFGDVNSNGKVDSNDGKYVSNEIKKQSTEKDDGITDTAWYMGDVDRNGILDEKDVEWFGKYEEYVNDGGEAGLREFITGEPDREDCFDYGSFGDGFTWAVTKDYDLVIGGEGEMPDVGYNWDECPWAYFTQTRKLKRIVIGEGITHISAYMFKNVGTVTEVVLPSTLDTVGEWAFTNCFAIEEVVLPEGTAGVGEYAFANCKSLEKVSIPSTMTTWGSKAFEDNDNLNSLIIADGVTEIGAEAFRGCESLETLDLPDSISSIGREAFSGCEGLKELKLPAGLNEIGTEAFSGCTSLKAVDLPDSLVKLGDRTFTDCTSLVELTIPGKTEKFGMNNIIGCSGLRALTIENPDCEIDTYRATVSDMLTIYGFSGSTAEEAASKLHVDFEVIEGENGALADGEISEGLTWTLNNRGTLIIKGKGSVPDFASDDETMWRKYADRITTVIIDGEVGSIGSRAFQDCTNLKNISLPDTVASFGENAFSGCGKLQTFEVPSALTAVGAGAFADCKSLYKLYFPDGLKEIKKAAFAGSGMYFVEIPDNVEAVEAEAFDRMENLYCISVGSSKTVLEGNADNFASRYVIVETADGSNAKKFADKNGLIYLCATGRDAEIASGPAGEECWWILMADGTLRIVGSGHMYNWGEQTVAGEEIKAPMGGLSPWDYCIEMRRAARTFLQPVNNVEIENGILSVGSNSFAYDRILESVEIPDSVEIIGADAFRGCTALRSAKLPEGLITIGDHAFAECPELETQLPGNVAEIGEGAFENNLAMDTVTVPESVRRIGSSAFSMSGLKDITILSPDCEIADSPSTISSGYSAPGGVPADAGNTGTAAAGAVSGYGYQGVIHGYSGSTAEKYAEKYGYKFEAIGEGATVSTEGTTVPGKEIVKGDANGDGKVNVSDAVTVLQYIANQSKYPMNDSGKAAADCDGEPGITGGDALAIQRIDAGIDL